MANLEQRLRAICQGDELAQQWLYDRFAPVLYRRFIARYQRMGLDPEDLLHDSFVFFFSRDAKILATFLERFSEDDLSETRLERYLWDQGCGIAANHRRAMSYRRTLPLDERAPSESADPETQSLNKDAISQLGECLKGADQRVYLYFKLRYVDGLRPDEVSEATGWSKKATYKLKGALNRAVAECATRLGLSL